jgi:hypothetical protein
MTTTEALEPPTHCRSCNALIWWRVNPSGKRQPFDYDSVTHEYTSMPHHATCPQGADWRNKSMDPKVLDALTQVAKLKVALAKISLDAEEALKSLE